MSEQLNQFNEDVDKWIKEKDEEGSVLKDNIVNLFKRAAVMSPAILKSYPGYTDSDTIMLVPDGSGSFKWIEAGSATPAETITITNAALSNNNTITITAASANTTKAIEYSLNGTSGWQSSNVFTNVANGTYANITARLVGSTITDKWDSSIVVNYTPNVAPTCSISLSSNSAVVNTSITVTATAADSDGTITKVELYVDGLKVQEDANSPYSFTYTPTSIGNKMIWAKAYDNAGANTNSNTITLSVTNPQATAYWGFSDSIALPNEAAILASALKVTFDAGTAIVTADWSSQSANPKFLWYAQPIAEPNKLKWQDTVNVANNGNIGQAEDDLFLNYQTVGAFEVTITAYATSLPYPTQLKTS